MHTDKTYDLTSAAKRLGLHRRSVRRLVDSGAITAETVGALTGLRYEISAKELASFEDKRAGDSA